MNTNNNNSKSDLLKSFNIETLEERLEFIDPWIKIVVSPTPDNGDGKGCPETPPPTPPPSGQQ